MKRLRNAALGAGFRAPPGTIVTTLSEIAGCGEAGQGSGLALGNLLCLCDRIDVHGLAIGIGLGGDRDVGAVKALDGIGVVDLPDGLFLFIDKHRLRAALDSLFDAGCTRAGVLGAAHGVGDPAIDGGGVGCTGRNCRKGNNDDEQSDDAFQVTSLGIGRI